VSQFGFLNLFDHPFLRFPLVGGKTLQLPCGTVPTALEEDEDSGSTRVLLMTSGGVMEWKVALGAEDIQAIFAAGSALLNRVTDGPAPIPFSP
jgi:hypothetical protein